jgi:hypothetical protein
MLIALNTAISRKAYLWSWQVVCTQEGEEQVRAAAEELQNLTRGSPEQGQGLLSRMTLRALCTAEWAPGTMENRARQGP